MATSQPIPQSNAQDLAPFVAALDKLILELAIQEEGAICRDARRALRAKVFGENCPKATLRRIAKYAENFTNTPIEDFPTSRGGRLMTTQNGTPKRDRRMRSRIAA